MIFSRNLVIFGWEIVLETVLEPKLAPRGAKIGFRGGWGARKLPQESENDRQDSAKRAQEGPEEAHLEALGADFWGNLNNKFLKFVPR